MIWLIYKLDHYWVEIQLRILIYFKELYLFSLGLSFCMKLSFADMVLVHSLCRVWRALLKLIFGDQLLGIEKEIYRVFCTLATHFSLGNELDLLPFEAGRATSGYHRTWGFGRWAFITKITYAFRRTFQCSSKCLRLI